MVKRNIGALRDLNDARSIVGKSPFSLPDAGLQDEKGMRAVETIVPQARVARVRKKKADEGE